MLFGFITCNDKYCISLNLQPNLRINSNRNQGLTFVHFIIFKRRGNKCDYVLIFNVIPIVCSTTFFFRGCIAFIHSTKKKFNQRNAYNYI